MPSEDHHNRIFILAGKDGANEDDFRKAFQEFGTITDIYLVKDRRTNGSKGIVYISFAKASQAALAIEEMNGRTMPGQFKPLKVLMAADRSEGNVRNDKEDPKINRIFVIVGKDMSEAEVKEEFQKFGEVDYVKVLTDRDSGQSKGLAFVTFLRAYHAALALEECDQKYRPVFASERHRKSRDATRRSSRDRYSDTTDYEYRPMASGSGYSMGGGGGGGEYSSSGSMRHSMASPLDLMHSYTALSAEDTCYLDVVASTSCEPEQLHRIFDLVPGLDYCNFDRYTGIASLRYKNVRCAAYARDKLSGLEYPPGYRLSIQGSSGGGDYKLGSADYSAGFSAGGGATGTDSNLQVLVDSIQKATSVLQQAGMSTSTIGGGAIGGGGGGEVRVRYCSISLPEKQPMAARDSPVEMRLFIVSQPDAFPERVLVDAFCRFGGLIDAFFMPGKNFGYAKFAQRESAQAAIDTLHGRHICEMRVKVLEAEAPRHSDSEESRSKRPRN